jgi:NAD(P)-dependent dehydrogenase (short-subunit alcohol dehydrogenase family)
MVSRGARYLLFLSRSGASSDAAKALVEELEAKSCHITVRICDVSDKEKLKETIEKYTSTMPPIMGCIQGAMELRVRLCWMNESVS